MTRGDFSSRVRVRGNNEFAQLAVAFNMMCDRLESLDKARNQFVSNASHELKTPLSTMKILIETLMYQDPMEPAMTREFLTDINKEIDRLNRIVSDLLTLVNIDSGIKMNLENLDIAALLQRQREAPAAAGPGAGHRDGLPGEEATVRSTATRKLHQVFYNLMDNAIKYTPGAARSTCTLTRQGKKAVIKVIDTGIGIPKEDQPHIFERFYRVDKARSRETGGTGLGLSIVKQIVLLHGGNIEATSKVGEGTTFTIELPLAAKRQEV